MVITENGWSNIQYNYAEKFNSRILASFFFNSFYLLVKFIILSLLTGLIWEIFTIINTNLKFEDQPLDNKQDSNEKKADLEMSESGDRSSESNEPVEFCDP